MCSFRFSGVGFFLFVAAFCRFCWSWNWRASAAAKGQQPRANGSQLQAFCRGLCWLVDACPSLCWANLIPNHSLTFRVAFGLYQIQPDTCCLRRGFFPWMVFVFVPKNLRIHQIIINLQVNRKGCVLLRCGVESHRFKYTARFFDLFISPCFHLLTFFGFLRERSLWSAGQEKNWRENGGTRFRVRKINRAYKKTSSESNVGAVFNGHFSSAQLSLTLFDLAHVFFLPESKKTPERKTAQKYCEGKLEGKNVAERGRLKKKKENNTPLLERKQQKKTQYVTQHQQRNTKNRQRRKKNEARFHLNKKKWHAQKRKRADEEHNVDKTHTRTTLLNSATLTNFLSKTKVSLLHGCSAVGDWSIIRGS